MKRLLGFALSFFLVCSIKLSVLGRVLPVVAYQGVPRHLLNLGLLLPMVALLCALPKRHLLALGAQMCLSMICVLHLVANRTLGDILSLMSVEQLSLVGYAGAGFLSSLVFSDFLYFLDIPIWIYWVCRPPVKRIRFWTTLLAAAGSGLFLQSLLWFTLTDMDKSRLASRRKNLGVMLTAGVTEYYVVDGLDFVSEFLTQDRYVPIDSRQIEENLSQLQSSWKTVGPLAGVWKGKNLWFIQLESLQAFALDAEVDGQPVMPFLRSFARHSLQLSRCYDQTASGVSLDCDFLVNNSLLPSVGRPTFYRYRNTQFYSLTDLLNELGYLTIYTQDGDPSFFNLPLITKHFGYQVRRFVNETPPDPRPEELIGIGMRDYAILYRVLRGLETVKGPFLAHIVCQMGHSPFAELRKDQEMLHLPPNLQGTTMGNYLQMCRFRDEELRRWFSDFSASPLSRNTVLCLFGDHAAPLPREELARLFGHSLQPQEYDEQQRIVCVFYDGVHHQAVEKACGLIDFAPTIVYLLGAVRKTPVWLGCNVFSSVQVPIVCRRYGFVVAANKTKSLDGSESTLPELTSEENEQVQRELLLSERLCLQNQIDKYAKGRIH